LARRTISLKAAAVRFDLYPVLSGRGQGRERSGLLQAFHEHIDFLRRLPIAFLRRGAVFPNKGAGHNLEGMADVVEEDQGIRQKENGLVGPQVVRCTGGQPLKIAHHPVTQITHSAAVKPRQSRRLDGTVFFQEILQMLQWISFVAKALDLAIVLDFHLLPPDAENNVRVGAEEGIPSPFLASFHALKKKNMRFSCELAQRRYGRLHISQDLPVNGDQISLSGQFFECFQVRIVHIPPANKKRP
jgi:hypothetical protein